MRWMARTWRVFRACVYCCCCVMFSVFDIFFSLLFSSGCGTPHRSTVCFSVAIFFTIFLCLSNDATYTQNVSFFLIAFFLIPPSYTQQHIHTHTTQHSTTHHKSLIRYTQQRSEAWLLICSNCCFQTKNPIKWNKSSSIPGCVSCRRYASKFTMEGGTYNFFVPMFIVHDEIGIFKIDRWS